MSRSAPVFPRSEGTFGVCGLCGDRLIRGPRPRTWIHELTASVRCPPVTRTCGVCEKDGLIQCGEVGCQMVVHPAGGCGLQCVCCGGWGCPAHVSNVDMLCTPCAGPHADHVQVPA